MPPTRISSITRAHAASSKNRQKQRKMIKNGHRKLYLQTPSNIKALKMETNFEEKFWSSVISISRVSAGKMHILWCMTRRKTL